MRNRKNQKQAASDQKIIIQTPEIDHQKTTTTYLEQVPESRFILGIMITLSACIILLSLKKILPKDTEDTSSHSPNIENMAIITMLALNVSCHFWSMREQNGTHDKRLSTNINAIKTLRDHLHDSAFHMHMHKASARTKFDSEKIHHSINGLLNKLFERSQLKIKNNNNLAAANKLAMIYNILNADKNTLSILLLLKDLLNHKWKEPLFDVAESFKIKETFWSTYITHSHTPILSVSRVLSDKETFELDQLINQISINHYVLKISKKNKKNMIVLHLQNVTAQVMQIIPKVIEPLSEHNEIASLCEKTQNDMLQNNRTFKYERYTSQEEQEDKEESNESTNVISTPTMQIAQSFIQPNKNNVDKIKNDHIIIDIKQENNFDETKNISEEDACFRLSSYDSSFFNNSKSLNTIKTDPVNEDTFLIVTYPNKHPNEQKKEYQIFPMPAYGNGKKPYFGFLTHQIENEKDVEPNKDDFITALGAAKIGGQLDRVITSEMRKTGHIVRLNDKNGKTRVVGRKFEYDYKIPGTNKEINLIIFDALYWKRHEWGTGYIKIEDDHLMKGNFRDRSFTLSIETRPRPETTMRKIKTS